MDILLDLGQIFLYKHTSYADGATAAGTADRQGWWSADSVGLDDGEPSIAAVRVTEYYAA